MPGQAGQADGQLRPVLHQSAVLKGILALPKREGWLLTIGVKCCPIVLLASQDGRCRESYDAQQAKRDQRSENLHMSRA